MLLIVGKNDQILYESVFTSKGTAPMTHFILHSSLDIVEEKTFRVPDFYLKNIDKQGENNNVYAYVTSGNTKFLLLIERMKEENTVNKFFQEIHELYTKALMNPLYEVNKYIKSSSFDEVVKKMISRYIL